MRLIALLAFFLFSIPASSGEIQFAQNLATDGKNANQSKQTIVILFSSLSCPYCDAVKSEFFQHLESDARYDGNVIVREVVIDSDQNSTDFKGQATTHSRFAATHDVLLVPTVGFFSGQGDELAKRIIGVGNMDFYGWYLDIRIKSALKVIRSHSLATYSDQSIKTG